jgi:hypothetical protein
VGIDKIAIWAIRSAVLDADKTELPLVLKIDL